ncbi:MAG: 2Fe-2S iron-sulfur cluster-binding protein [Saprospiraceae bacterium]
MNIKLNIKVWRQKSPNAQGAFETYQVTANTHMSFLEMLDVLNEDLIQQRKEPVAFEHDCREGICGTLAV